MWKDFLIGLSMFLSSCAGQVQKVEPPIAPTRVTEPPSIEGVLALYGHETWAHACPCEGVVLTAGHVAGLWYADKEAGQIRAITQTYAWVGSDGSWGFALGSHVSDFLDVGKLKLLTGVPPKLHTMAAGRVTPGQRVWWAEFDDKSIKSVRVEGTILYTQGPYAAIDTAPKPGSSGSCVLDANGEVVGIVVWGVNKKDSKGVIFLVDAMRGDND